MRAGRVLLDLALLVLAVYVLLVLTTAYWPSRAYLGPTGAVACLLVLAFFRFALRFGNWPPGIAPGPAIFIGVLLVYLANRQTGGSGDTIPARYLPLSLIREGNFDLNEFPFLYQGGTPYYLQLINGRYVSWYPIAAALGALPFYLPSALGRVRAEHPVVLEVEKLAAATMIALSVLVLYRALRRVSSPGMSAWLSIAYALGTSSFSVSSQALWQHVPGQLALAAAIYCLIRGRIEPTWSGLAGFPLAFAAICRPTNVLIVVPLALYVLLRQPGQSLRLVLSGAPPLLFQLWYNSAYLGNPLTSQIPLRDPWWWRTPFWEGLAGLLFSPSRGLFVYSPIFLFSVAGIVLASRRNGDVLVRYLSVSAVLVLSLFSRWSFWQGGHSFGPRIVAELSVLLAVCVHPLQLSLERSRLLRGLAAAALAWSVAAHAIGAFQPGLYWHIYYDVDRFPERHWSWTNNQLVNPVTRIRDRLAIFLRDLPTSRARPGEVSATWAISKVPELVPTSSPHGASLPRWSITVTNTGRSVWLTSVSGRPGVALGWEWFHDRVKLVGLSGSEALYLDVFPGETYEFHVVIGLPPEGSHRLVFSLVVAGSERNAVTTTPLLEVSVTTARDPDHPGFTRVRTGISRPATP